MNQNEITLKDIGKFFIWPSTGYLLGSLISTGIMLSNPELTDSVDLNFFECWGKSLKGGWTGVELAFAFISGTIGIFFMIIKNHNNYLNKLVQNIESKEIVLYPGMKGYDEDHIVALEEILFSNNEKENNGPVDKLIAFDATEPNKWWTNDMLGYLALQCRWKNQKPDREVIRVFIWNKNWIGSTPGNKLLKMHQMYGFQTIICPPEIFKKFVKKEDFKREILIWDDDNARPAKKAYKIGINTYGYESYHKYYHEQYERDKILIEEKIKVTENERKNFIEFKRISQERAIGYRQIFQELISNISTQKKVKKITSFKYQIIKNNLIEFLESY